MLSRRGLIQTGIAALTPWPAVAVAGEPAADPGFILGTQTHFSQGWLLPWMDRARDLGTKSLRDGLAWPSIETRRGVYAFDPYRVDYLDKARRDGVRILLCIDPRHPAYDDGHTAFSPEAQQAYASYLNAVLDRYGDVVGAIEVGNEINGAGGMDGPASAQRAKAHVSLLTAVYRTVKPRHSDVKILGGSTNVIGVGFLETIFEAGGLDVMDGVAVHPYRTHAENVDVELSALTAAMARHGRVVPIHATEFGSEFDDAALSSPLMLKMVAMLGAAGLPQASWYALSDEAAFRNMGLFTQRQALKPAGETFRFLQRSLLGRDRPVRVETDDLAHVYRFGGNGIVAWGAPRPIRVKGQGQARDARGRPISMPTALSDTPFVVLGDVQLELQPGDCLADSLYQFGSTPWSYFARGADEVLHPLDWVNWDWTSYIGDRRFQPLAFNPTTLAPAGDRRGAISAILRYAPVTAGRVVYSVTISPSGTGDGVDVAIVHAGQTLRSAVVSETDFVFEEEITVAAGATIDLVVGPNQTFGGDLVTYRATVRKASS